MIQEPVRQQQQTLQTESRQIYADQLSTNENVQIIQPRISSGHTAIPIVIDSSTDQTIILITSPAHRAHQEHQQHAQALYGQQIQDPQIRTRTRVIRLPFLPGPEPISLLVKKNLPIRKNLNQSLDTDTPLNGPNTHSLQEQTFNTSAGTVYSTVKDCCAERRTTQLTTSRPKPSMTLASMAGIQLTGAEDSYQQQDMSGAMPTATVEEISVPVFIDEYLQQLNGSSTTTTAAATDSNNYNQNNGKDNVNGPVNFISIDEPFENFEFDIDMIGQENIEVRDTSFCNMGTYDSNNNHNNDNNNTTTTATTANTTTTIPTTPTTPTTTTIHNNNNHEDILEMYSKFDDIEEHFQILPYSSQNDEIYHDLQWNENAVDINNFNNDGISLMITNPENSPSCGSSAAFSSFCNELPRVSAEVDDDYKYKIDTPMEELNVGSSIVMNGHDVDVDVDVDVGVELHKTLSSRMAKKRLHLQLNKRSDYKQQQQQQQQQEQVLLTPDIINLITDLKGDITNLQSVDEIKERLFNLPDSTDITENNESTIDFPIEENIYDQPFTPESVASSSHTASYTDYTTSPNSPALSTASITIKRKRGRPAKPHSDKPNPEWLQKLNENERKQAIDRANNNEASRRSRLRSKLREEAEFEEENKLMKINLEFKVQLQNLELIESKLKRALQKR